MNFRIIKNYDVAYKEVSDHLSQIRIQEKMIYHLKNIVKLIYLTKGLNYHN
jgi:hypothetical protein